MSRHKKDCVCNKCNQKFMDKMNGVDKELDDMLKGILSLDEFKEFNESMKKAKKEERIQSAYIMAKERKLKKKGLNKCNTNNKVK